VRGLLRGVVFLVLSLAIGQIIKRVLTSRVGRSVLGRVGHPEFATLEGAEEASKRVKQGIELVRSLAPGEPKPEVPREREPVGPRWVRVVRDASEMLLVTGGLLKAVADFVREDEQLRRRLRRIGARVE
jgi:hypothetical protein